MASKGWCNSSSRSNGITTINVCKSSKSSSYPTGSDHSNGSSNSNSQTSSSSSTSKNYGELAHNPSQHAHNNYKAGGNTNIKSVFATFCTNLLSSGVTVNNTQFPFYTYSSSTRLFSLNFPISLYDQNALPQISFYMDSTSGDLFGCPRNIYTQEKDTNYLMLCYDVYNNTVDYNNENYYTMTASQNQFNIWCPVKRILFSITDLPVRLEIENSFTNIAFTAQDNNSLSSINRPNLNIFFDLSVNQDEWALNRNVVQYAVSSIAESRLVNLGSGSYIRNFTINIFWTDTFGNYRPLLASPNSQNNLKLVLYSKKTMLV